MVRTPAYQSLALVGSPCERRFAIKLRLSNVGHVSDSCQFLVSPQLASFNSVSFFLSLSMTLSLSSYSFGEVLILLVSKLCSLNSLKF